VLELDYDQRCDIWSVGVSIVHLSDCGSTIRRRWWP